MRPAHRRLSRAATAGFVTAAILTALLPALPTLARDPIKVTGRQVHTTVERQRTVRLPITASHVVLNWTGDHEAAITVAFGMTPNALGEEVPVEHSEDVEAGTDESVAARGGAGAAVGRGAEAEEAAGDVIWTGGAKFVRITSDRPLKRVTVVAIDAQADKGFVPGGIAVASAAMNQPPIIRRAAWGADESLRFDSGGKEVWPPSFTPMQKAIVHHTAGRNNDPNPAATVRAIYWLYAVSRDFGDMGYNFLIDEQGRIYEGRYSRPYAAGETPTGEDLAGNVVRGGHATNFNDGTVGIVLLGTFTNRQPTSAALGALERLLAWKLERHGLSATGASTYRNTVLGNTKWLYNISGHRNVSQTACPGNTFYPTFPQLRQRVANRIAATTGASHDTTAPQVKSLTAMATDPTGAHTIPFGLIFKEPIEDLDASDFELDGTSHGWSVADVSGAGAAWTVQVTAATPDDGTVRLTLAQDAVTDFAGLTGPPDAVTGTANFAQDEDAPTVVLYQSPHRKYIGDPEFEYFNVTATFSEPVTGFSASDVVLGGSSHAATPWKVPAMYGSGANYGFSVVRKGWANGTLTFQVPAGAVEDMAGNPMQASNLVSVVMDKSAPITGSPVASLAQGGTLGGVALRTRISWSASDIGPAGITGFDVMRSVDGGPFRALPDVGDNAFAINLTKGHTYRFEVRGRDKAGNVGAWKAGPTFKARLLQQNHDAIRFTGRWTRHASPAFSGGSARVLLAAGSSARLRTTMRSVSFVTTTGPNRGAVRILIDGVLVKTIDLYSDSTVYRYVAYSKTWSSAGVHTIKVVAVGTPGRPRVIVDAFGVLR
jgi:N-acetylmuramoyl-L-alanine amidase-like protein